MTSIAAYLSDLINEGKPKKALWDADHTVQRLWAITNEDERRDAIWVFYYRGSAGLLCPDRYAISDYYDDWTWARLYRVSNDPVKEAAIHASVDLAFQCDLILRHVRDHNDHDLDASLARLDEMRHGINDPNLDAFVLMVSARRAYTNGQYLLSLRLHQDAQKIWFDDLNVSEREKHWIRTNEFHMLRSLMMCRRIFWRIDDRRQRLVDKITHDPDKFRRRHAKIMSSGRIGAHVEQLLSR
jgi:hypothetical protein